MLDDINVDVAPESLIGRECFVRVGGVLYRGKIRAIKKDKYIIEYMFSVCRHTYVSRSLKRITLIPDCY